MKEQEKSPEKELNEMEANNFSDMDFKVMVIRMLKELNENWKHDKGHRNHEKTTTGKWRIPFLTSRIYWKVNDNRKYN